MWSTPSLGFGSALESLLYCSLWKIRCKFVFEQEISSLSVFCAMWCDEVHHPLLAKGALLIKDVQALDSVGYSNFISALLVLWKRCIRSSLPFFDFLFVNTFL
jgi:hypothetical protein